MSINLPSSKHDHLFRLVFDGFGRSGGVNVLLSSLVERCTRPSITFVGTEQTPSNFMVELLDDMDGHVSAEVSYQLSRQSISISETFDCIFERLAYDQETVIEAISACDCRLSKVEMSALDYSTASSSNIRLTIVPKSVLTIGTGDLCHKPNQNKPSLEEVLTVPIKPV